MVCVRCFPDRRHRVSSAGAATVLLPLDRLGGAQAEHAGVPPAVDRDRAWARQLHVRVRLECIREGHFWV